MHQQIKSSFPTQQTPTSSIVNQRFSRSGQLKLRLWAAQARSTLLSQPLRPPPRLPLYPLLRRHHQRRRQFQLQAAPLHQRRLPQLHLRPRASPRVIPTRSRYKKRPSLVDRVIRASTCCRAVLRVALFRPSWWRQQWRRRRPDSQFWPRDPCIMLYPLMLYLPPLL